MSKKTTEPQATELNTDELEAVSGGSLNTVVRNTNTTGSTASSGQKRSITDGPVGGGGSKGSDIKPL